MSILLDPISTADPLGEPSKCHKAFMVAIAGANCLSTDFSRIERVARENIHYSQYFLSGSKGGVLVRGDVIVSNHRLQPNAATSIGDIALVIFAAVCRT